MAESRTISILAGSGISSTSSRNPLLRLPWTSNRSRFKTCLNINSSSSNCSVRTCSTMTMTMVVFRHARARARVCVCVCVFHGAERRRRRNASLWAAGRERYRKMQEWICTRSNRVYMKRDFSFSRCVVVYVFTNVCSFTKHVSLHKSPSSSLACISTDTPNAHTQTTQPLMLLFPLTLPTITLDRASLVHTSA